MKSWYELPFHADTVHTFQQQLNQVMEQRGEKPFSEIAIQHLIANGITTVPQAVAFLYPSANQLHTPWEMVDMHHAVSLLHEAIEQQKRITIVSDYDVDGVCSNVIAFGALRQMGANVDYIVPHRVTDGYGLKEAIVQRCIERKTDVILTVDNGINAHSAIALAKQNGIQVVITDHHLPSHELPPADAIVNPNRMDCRYPFKGICGSVVALKVMESLNEYRMERGQSSIRMNGYQQLACLATIADVMPLHDENRLIVNRGLALMREKPLVGLRALLDALNIKPESMESETLAFYVAPCLNACGRLDSAEKAVDLLLCTKTVDAMTLAHQAIQWNNLRKAKQQSILATLQTREESVQVLLTDAHEGIVGLLAGQVVERTGCPAIVLTASHEEGIVKGSGRSHNGFSLHEALEHISKQHPEWFVGWGGHGVACGLSVYEKDVDNLRFALNEFYQQTPSHGLQKPVLASLSSISAKEVVEEFERLKPFGQGNKKPLFQISGKVLDVQTFGENSIHQRVALFQPNGNVLEVTHFKSSSNEPAQVGEEWMYYITLGKGTWKGKPQIDALVEGRMPVASDKQRSKQTTIEPQPWE